MSVQPVAHENQVVLGREILKVRELPVAIFDGDVDVISHAHA